MQKHDAEVSTEQLMLRECQAVLQGEECIWVSRAMDLAGVA